MHFDKRGKNNIAVIIVECTLLYGKYIKSMSRGTLKVQKLHWDKDES